MVGSLAGSSVAWADYTDQSLENSSEGSTLTTETFGIVVASAAVVAAVVVVVVVVDLQSYPHAEAGGPVAEAEGRALVEQGLVGGDGLPEVLAELVESPASFDALTTEAARGGGPQLDALAAASGVAPGEVAAAWLAGNPAPARTREEAFAGVVRVVERLGPALRPRAERAAQLVDALATEAADGPAHTRLARWTGVPTDILAPVVTRVLAGRDRAARHADALGLVDDLGRALGASFPAELHTRTEEVLATGRHLGVTLASR